MNLNSHDLVWMNVDREKMNANIFRALKPGGIYAIVDHSAQAGSGIRDVKTLHRIDQRVVEDEVTKSGFSLAETSSALGHPEDDRTWMVFQRRGETDRFMLKFMKS
jgi:predicted methyltransferase